MSYMSFIIYAGASPRRVAKVAQRGRTMGELLGCGLFGAHFSTTQTLRRGEEFVWWKSAFWGGG